MMLRLLPTFLFLILSLGGNQSQARVFVFDKETVAPYLSIRGGLSSMGSAPYAWQSAGQYSGDEVDLLYGGEFGAYFKGRSFGLSIGVLVYTMDPVEGAIGSQTDGTQLYRVGVESMTFGPSLQIHYLLSKSPTWQWKLQIGGGYQYSKFENSYTFTTAGQALVGGQNTLDETYKSESPFATAGITTEFVLAGSTTISVMAGYHYVFNHEWNYGNGVRNFSGTSAQGDSVVLEDASPKTIDLSYPFIQVGFNFYVDTVR